MIIQSINHCFSNLEPPIPEPSNTKLRYSKWIKFVKLSTIQIIQRVSQNHSTNQHQTLPNMYEDACTCLKMTNPWPIQIPKVSVHFVKMTSWSIGPTDSAKVGFRVFQPCYKYRDTRSCVSYVYSLQASVNTYNNKKGIDTSWAFLVGIGRRR